MIDPALQELYETGSPSAEVKVIMRLREGTDPPANVRIVSRFGPEIVTARITRRDIPRTREDESVLSMKAGRPLTLPTDGPRQDEDDVDGEDEEYAGLPETVAGPRAAPPVPEDGRGVVIGICDSGMDFTHANFRNPDGSTRLLALWDQRGEGHPSAPAPFGYGRVHERTAIDAALRQPDPCAALGYHPGLFDSNDRGCHGTHVADILAGNRREPGSEVGLASASDIIFVHLGSQRLGELANLGDSVTLLEGLDFIRRRVVGQSCVMHLSIGKTCGDHLGKTPVERAVDAMLTERAGLALVQSVGNYGDSAMHQHGRVGPGQCHELEWLIPRDDRTPNELELWYGGEDAFVVELIAPHGERFTAPLGQRTALRSHGVHWGNFYHRAREPNSGQNHVDIFLYDLAPGGRWRVIVHGREVVDGRFHAWIERDAGSRYQSRFARRQATSLYTTNTICNSYRAIAVGAYDGTQRSRPPTRFTSAGPTVDGRLKPELSAPGYRIRAARSIPRRGWADGEPKLCVKSGTSMAAPWVSGTVALMMQAARRPLSIHEIRRILVSTADPPHGSAARNPNRLGFGYLNVVAAVEAARRIAEAPDQTPAARVSVHSPAPPASAELVEGAFAKESLAASPLDVAVFGDGYDIDADDEEDEDDDLDWDEDVFGYHELQPMASHAWDDDAHDEA